MTRISFVSAVRDEAPYIADMINSWAVQAGDTELIIVDDNSTDETPKIVADLADELPGLTLLILAEHEGQRGKVAGFNLGVSQAKGDFISLFCGDDLMPFGSVQAWLDAIEPYETGQKVAAFGKLRTISDSPKHDDLVLPRGTRGERSGATSLFSKGLSDIVFPIPTHLPSEDIWTSFLLESLADVVIEVNEVILRYRIHPGNSNPRGLPFDQMSERIAVRKQANVEIRERMSHLLTPSEQARLQGLIDLEAARQSGNPRAVLAVRGVSWTDRVRTLSMTTAPLWATRQRFFRFFSGW